MVCGINCTINVLHCIILNMLTFLTTDPLKNALDLVTNALMC